VCEHVCEEGVCECVSMCLRRGVCVCVCACACVCVCEEGVSD
jgi:hypothetical protein